MSKYKRAQLVSYEAKKKPKRTRSPDVFGAATCFIIQPTEKNQIARRVWSSYLPYHPTDGEEPDRLTCLEQLPALSSS